MSTTVINKEKIDKQIQQIGDFTFERLPIAGYEKVLKISNKKTKLLAIVAIHDATLGVALGGTRIAKYKTFEAALEDALRLSKGMTYKSAVSEVGLGGGKSVIIADPKTEKTHELLYSFGQAIDLLNGEYICAEDMGCTTEDVMIIRQATKYVTGLPHKKSSGDPGPFTAWGCFRGIQATLNKIYGSPSVEGKKIAIQGLGNVGLYLADYLFWAGAELIVSDLSDEKLKNLTLKYGAKAVSLDEIYEVECDIFVPCALGGIINDETIPKFKCKGIAGSANNQLLRDEHGEELKNRNILYAPDFVINAGGLLNVTAELQKDGYHPKQPRKKTDNIYQELTAIYKIAESNSISTNKAAIELAKHKIANGIGKRTIAPTFHDIA